MIDVAKLEVRSFDLDHLDLFWELISSDEDTTRYDFYILRSVDGPAGPFREISRSLHNTFMFRDPDVHLLHKWRTYYYRIRVVSKDTGDVKEFGPQWLQAEPDRIALEIQRRHQLMFKKINGRKVMYFSALTFGQRCRHCYDRGPRDNTLGRPKQQNCATCFDVGFVGGYATPMVAYIQIDPSPKTILKTDTSERAPVTTSGRLSCFPPMKAKDMIVEAENKRWSIQKVTTTEKQRAIVHQELVLHEIPKGDVVYKVPVNMDLQSEFTSAYNITRPMTNAPKANSPVVDMLGGPI